MHVHAFVDEPISHAQPSVGGTLPTLRHLMMQWEWMGAVGGGAEGSWAHAAVINFVVIYTLKAEVNRFDQLRLPTQIYHGISSHELFLNTCATGNQEYSS